VWTCGEEDSVNSRRESGWAQNGAGESPAGEDPDPLTTYHNWKKKSRRSSLQHMDILEWLIEKIFILFLKSQHF